MLSKSAGTTAGIGGSRTGARYLLGFGILLVLAAVYAAAVRFIQDDAYISFRYAENLVRGFGPVWEPGVAVQGYTNFLWMLVVAAGMVIGADPLVTTYVVGIACFVGTLGFLVDVVRRATGSDLAGLGTGLFLLVNFSVVSYATGGLETSLETMLLTAALWQAWRVVHEKDFGTRPLIVLSLIFALAGLTRLDSAIFIACLSLAVLGAAIGRTGPRESLRVAVALLGPGVAVLIAYLVFGILYYGDPLPNTFYAKSGDFTRPILATGARYVLLFIAQYALVLPGLLILTQIPALLREPVTAGALAAVVLWPVYVVLNGGDFMEFRLMVPMMPFFAFLTGRAWLSFSASLSPRQGLVALGIGSLTLCYMSLHHGMFFRDIAGVEYTRGLMSHLHEPSRDWLTVGTRLREVFPQGYDEDAPYFAIRPAGAIPFNSKLRFLDMLGLNDRWVARNGVQGDTVRAGHRVVAPLDHVVARGVNLVVGHPILVERDAHRVLCTADFRFGKAVPEPGTLAVLEEASIVRMPVNARFDLAMMYLTPHPAVDQALRDGTLVQSQDKVAYCP